MRNVSSKKVAVTETIAIPAGAAGVVVDFDVTTRPIASLTGADLGGVGNTSFVLTSTAFTTLVNPKDDTALANGEYYLDHLTGRGRGKKADTSTSGTAAFSVFALKTILEGGDIQVGAVEIKDGTTDNRAVVNPANTARSATDNVILVQTIDALGNVGSASDIAKVGSVAVPTVGADGVSNTRSDVPVSSRSSGFNGTTWDRIRAGITAVTATLTGFLNTLPWAIYNTTPTARTNGQGGPLQSNVNGDLNSNLNTYLRGEDPVFNVLKTQVRGTYTVPLTASGLVFTGPGQLMGFIINSCAAGATLKIWDNTSAATTVVCDTMTFTAAEAQGPKVVMFPAAVQLNTGCYFTIAVAAMSVTPIWNQT